MWAINGHELKMAEGDFGIAIPITIGGTTLTSSDEIKIVIKDKVNGNVILTKTYGNIVQNTFDFELTEAESSLLPVGNYVYSLDWYQDGAFMCNIILSAAFKVVDKA